MSCFCLLFFSFSSRVGAAVSAFRRFLFVVHAVRSLVQERSNIIYDAELEDTSSRAECQWRLREKQTVNLVHNISRGEGGWVLHSRVWAANMQQCLDIFSA